jgi:hypothetical protein
LPDGVVSKAALVKALALVGLQSGNPSVNGGIGLTLRPADRSFPHRTGLRDGLCW